ncbi:MAG: hypothetical protein Aurels2KO_24400 [Aureliella sp.]
MEDGTGILVGQVEAPDGSNNYLPNAGSAEFFGKTITDGSGTNAGTNGHAQSVGIRQYGNSTSISPGVTSITGYEANDWINRVLGFDTDPGTAGEQKAVPSAQNFSVMNHSYIGNGLTSSSATEYNRRMDLVAERDNVTMVVAANNGSANATPQLFAPSYNSITVGLTDGTHSHTPTSVNGSGRLKPEIVAPHGTMPSNSFTSFSTPVVASAAALLRHKGSNMGGGNAIRNEVTKAVLLAGATKDEFSGWSNTPTQPLDGTYGAGELNIYNSYHILDGGEFDGGAIEAATLDVAARGWDYEANLADAASLYYNFEVTSPSAEASVILTWNVDISDAGGILDYDTLNLANLDLRLYDSSSSFLGSLIGESISTIDNTEHLYLQGLTPGDYTIAVNSTSGSTDYALAWQFTAVPEPSALTGGLIAMAGVLLRRRRLPT